MHLRLTRQGGREEYRRRVEKIRGGSVRLTRIVDGLFENAFVRISDLPGRLG